MAYFQGFLHILGIADVFSCNLPFSLGVKRNAYIMSVAGTPCTNVERTKMNTEQFSTKQDLRIFKRDNEWWWCFADDYTDGPFSWADEFGPFDTLRACCDAINQDFIDECTKRMDMSPEELNIYLTQR